MEASDAAHIARLFNIDLKEAVTCEYLGDGLYATWDGYQFWLRASNGIQQTNTVALDPRVSVAFDRYRERFKA